MNEPIGFPTLQEYRTALLNPEKSFVSPRLKGAVPQRVGQNFFWGQGRFAVVAKVVINGEHWALRLPLLKQAGADDRYKAISKEVSNGNTLFAPVEYFSQGIDVPVGSNLIRPVVLMKWVNGLSVRDYVIELCTNNESEGLLTLRSAFESLAESLMVQGVVHGDLSPDNILVEVLPDGVRLQLVDYDSVQILHLGEIATSVGLTPMRHPRGPVQPDIMTDAFPLLIYYAVLSSLAINPTLGQSPDNYDQKFLVDSITLAEGMQNKLVKDLSVAAPLEFGALLDSLNNPYDQTPSIIKTTSLSSHTNPIILASDWMQLHRYIGKTVEIIGFVKQIVKGREFVMTTPSRINRETTVGVVSVNLIHSLPNEGDFIRALGTVNIVKDKIIIRATAVELDNRAVDQIYGIVLTQAIRSRITDAIARIRGQRDS